MTQARPGTTSTYDLLVIGAGPAGATAAFKAAVSGLRVALIDKKRFPRNKLCGGGITGRAMRHYKRIYGETAPEIPLVVCSDLSFFAFGKDLGLNKGAPPIYLGMRYALDDMLVRHAIGAGAHDYTGQPGHLDPETLTFSTDQLRLTAPLVIAADGVNSPTAKLLFGQAFDQSEIGFALEIEHPAPTIDPLRIDFGAADWGYGWRFPKTQSTTIGIGGVLSRNADMKAKLAHYLQALNIQSNAPVKGQFLPFGAYRKVPGRGAILLAGDAAGLVDPITGEGIAHALHSGELAAIAAQEALAAGTPTHALGLYQRKLRPIHSALSNARLLRNIMFRETLRPTFIRSFHNSRTLRSQYLRLLAGETDYGPLMRQMTTRLPGFAWRRLRGI